MVAIGGSEYGVTTCEFIYQKVKITATYEKIIEVPVEDDIEDAVDRAIGNIDLSDFDYDYNVIGEETELVYLKE